MKKRHYCTIFRLYTNHLLSAEGGGLEVLMEVAIRAHRLNREGHVEASFMKILLTSPFAEKKSSCIAYFGAEPG